MLLWWLSIWKLCSAYSTDISNNAATKGRTISTDNCVILTFNGASSFSSNSAMKGEAIFANSKSRLAFNGYTSFTSNGNHGNKFRIKMKLAVEVQCIWLFHFFHFALHNCVLEAQPCNFRRPGSHYCFYNLSIYCTQIARYTGIPREECFFQLCGQNFSSGFDVHSITTLPMMQEVCCMVVQ